MNLGGFGHVFEFFNMFQRVSTVSDTFSVPDLAGLDSTGAVPGFVGRSGEGVCSVQGVHSGKWRAHTECTHVYTVHLHTFTFYIILWSLPFHNVVSHEFILYWRIKGAQAQPLCHLRDHYIDCKTWSIWELKHKQPLDFISHIFVYQDLHSIQDLLRSQEAYEKLQAAKRWREDAASMHFKRLSGHWGIRCPSYSWRSALHCEVVHC